MTKPIAANTPVAVRPPNKGDVALLMIIGKEADQSKKVVIRKPYRQAGAFLTFKEPSSFFSNGSSSISNIFTRNAKLWGYFGTAKRWKNCPATAAGYALFVVAPESEDFHHLLVLQYLVDQAMLNINAARIGPRKITN